MSTPSIQTLITQAQQVLNLKSSNEIRATLAAILANANVGTPLNPNLTTQQLWDEFYEIVRQPSDDIMSIITDQMMRMVFSPPAPGGAGADKQVIFNDGGVLAGDPDLIFNKAFNKLVANNIETAAGLLVGTSATITGDLTVDTSTLKVDSANNRVGVGTASPAKRCEINQSANAFTTIGEGEILRLIGDDGNTVGRITEIGFGTGPTGAVYAPVTLGAINTSITGYNHKAFYIATRTGTSDVAPVERYRIANDGIATWSNVGGVAGTAMTLNANGLGVGVVPSAWNNTYNVLDIGQNGSISGRTSTNNSVDIVSNGFRNSGGTWVYKLATSNAASRYLIDGSTGGHLWYSGAAGTAGNTIAGFSTATMTLDASGRLILLASTTTPATLNNNGELTFTATSNTNLRFSYRGSDGVTRVADLTLA